jgi:hypothetical protein
MSNPSEDSAFPEKSALSIYSVGIVAANKKLDSDLIEVVPTEHVSFVDGELTDNKEEIKVASENFDGSSWEETLVSTPSITAKWFPLGNVTRKTAPDVRRGEKVVLFKFGDADEYHWVEWDQGKKLRRLETISYALSNNSKEDIEDSPTTTYWLEWSTHRKLVHLHTSKNDGEPFAWDIQLDTKEGNLTIKDDDGRIIFIQSKEDKIHVENKAKSFIDIDKKNITIECKETLTINAKDIITTARASIVTKTKKHDINDTTFSHRSSSYSVNANNWTTNSSRWSVTSSSPSFNAPTVRFSSNINIGGNSYASKHVD